MRQGVQGSDIQVYDPVVKSLPEPLDVVFCKDAYQASTNVDVLFINTAWDEFRSLDLRNLVKTARTQIIVDPFNLLGNRLPDGVKHVTLGKPQ